MSLLVGLHCILKIERLQLFLDNSVVSVLLKFHQDSMYRLLFEIWTRF